MEVPGAGGAGGVVGEEGGMGAPVAEEAMGQGNEAGATPQVSVNVQRLVGPRKTKRGRTPADQSWIGTR
jgi:hypothetical protein